MRIYMIAICGVGMAPLAVLLKEAGHEVVGSDQLAFAPMRDVLATAGIPIHLGFDPQRLEQLRPDLVIVGNAVSRTNPEAAAAERLGLERTSFPAALASFFLKDRLPLVVAGTHGKTTTAGMLAAALDRAGREPGYLIGGLIHDLGAFARAGRAGGYFVVEGDEYDTAYFDKRPKFVHYRPHAAILTSVEFDHADIYGTIDDVHGAFARLIDLLPKDEPLVACIESEGVRALVGGVPRLVTYGTASDATWALRDLSHDAGGTTFTAEYRGRREALIRLVLAGRMNALNALAVYALARELGVDGRPVREGLAEYRGAARRQEELATAGGVTVVDDFAHHPTAVKETLAALRARYPNRPIRAVFEPRSNTSRRAVFQSAYADALACADAVVVSAVFRKESDPIAVGDMLSVERLVADLGDRRVPAWSAAGPDAILERLLGELQPGEVVVCMSNGAFGNLPRRLVDGLRARETRGAAV